MSNHEDGSILSASVIKHRSTDVAFDRFLDNLVYFLEENLVSLLLAVRGNLVFSSLNISFDLIYCIILIFILVLRIYGYINIVTFGTVFIIFYFFVKLLFFL